MARVAESVHGSRSNRSAGTLGARPRAGRRIRVVVIAIFLLGLAYPVGVNLFLALGGVQKLFEDTDTVKVHFRRAWSFWPGTVHVDDIRVVVQDRNIQFAMDCPTMVVDVKLRDLVHRRFHATRVRGQDLVFRFRHRIEPEAVQLPSVSAFPPIPEFEDPPLRQAGPPLPPIDEAHYPYWTIHIEDVDVAIRELWFQMFRYEGSARATGAFRLRPVKQLWVGPAELRVEGGKLSSGPHEVLRGFSGTITCKVDDFDPEPLHGMEIFQFISSRAKLSSQVRGLEVIDFLTGPSPPFKVEDGSGALDVDAAIDHGAFSGASRIEYRTSHLGVTVDRTKFWVDGGLSLLATGPANEPGGQLAVRVPSGSFQLEGSKRPPLRLTHLEASARSTAADATLPWEFAGGQARLEKAELSDLRWLDELPLSRPRSWSMQGGSGYAFGSMTLSSQRDLDGSVGARVDAAVATLNKLSVRGSAESSATFHADGGGLGWVRARLSARPLKVTDDDGASGRVADASANGFMTLSPAKGASGEIRASTGEWIGSFGQTRIVGSALTGHLEFSPAKLLGDAQASGIRVSSIEACPWTEIHAAALAGHVLTPKGAPSMAAVEGELEGVSVKWGTFQLAGSSATFNADFQSGMLAASVNAIDLRLKSSGGAPRGWQADVASTAIRSDLRIEGSAVKGPARLEVSGVAARVGKTDMRGDMVADLRLISDDESHRTADASGTVKIERVAFNAADKELGDWWAEFNVHDAHIDSRQNLDVTAKVQAKFRDGLPALNVLASEGQIPSWVPKVLPLKPLTLDLRIERFCRWTDVQIASAAGGPLRAQGRIQLEPGETRGAILFRLAALAPVSLGLDFVEDFSASSPLAGSGWLEEHMLPLGKAATEKHDTRCEPEPPECE